MTNVEILAKAVTALTEAYELMLRGGLGQEQYQRIRLAVLNEIRPFVAAAERQVAPTEPVADGD